MSLIEQEDLAIKIFLQEGNTNTKVKQIWSSLVYESISLFKEFFSDRIGTGELKNHNTEVSSRCLFSILIAFHLTRGLFKGNKLTKVQFIDNMLDGIFLGIKGSNK